MIGYQFLLEVDALTSANVPETLSFCCQPGFTSTGRTWLPNIVDPGLMQTDLFSEAKTSGASTYSFGEIVLGNFKNVDALEGGIDFLKQYQFYGRSVRMYVGLMDADFDTGGFTRAYTAIIKKPNTHWDTFSFTLHGRQAELDITLARAISDAASTTTRTDIFLGTNAAPNGLEGNADLKDAFKPLMVGRPAEFTPVMCNSSKLIYACSVLIGIATTEMGADIHVYDKGVELACSGIVSLAVLQSTAPPAGQYAVCTEGYIRLGSSPVGTVTVSCVSVGMGMIAHPTTIINTILTASGFNSGTKDMINASTFTGISADKRERGIGLSSDTPISQILDRLLAPLGYYYYDANGFLVCGRLSDPAGREAESVFYLDAATNIDTFDVIPSQDTTAGIPPKSITIQYNRNYTPQADITGPVSLERKARLKEEFSKSTLLNPGIIHPLAEEMVINTDITNDVAGLLAELGGFYFARREVAIVKVLKSDFNAARVVLPGQIVRVDLHGRFNYSGKPTVVMSKTVNWLEEAVTFKLWS